jgi:hypothetical protein
VATDLLDNEGASDGIRLQSPERARGRHSQDRLLRQRGQFLATRWSARTIATLHPSAVLRGQDEPAQARLYAILRDDLRLVAAVQ